MSRVWDTKEISKQGELLVMLCLADFANDDGESWPSVGRVAEKCRLSERAVQYILSKLRADGLIEVIKGGDGPRDTNRYLIRVQKLHPLEKRVQTDAVKGANGDIKGCKSFAPDPSVPVIRSITISHDKEFGLFWTAYPRKVNRRKAAVAFEKSKAWEILDTILTAIDKQRRSTQWKQDGGKYIPHPTSWLNGCRWEDEVQEQKLF